MLEEHQEPMFIVHPHTVYIMWLTSMPYIYSQKSMSHMQSNQQQAISSLPQDLPRLTSYLWSSSMSSTACCTESPSSKYSGKMRRISLSALWTSHHSWSRPWKSNEHHLWKASLNLTIISVVSTKESAVNSCQSCCCLGWGIFGNGGGQDIVGQSGLQFLYFLKTLLYHGNLL